MLFCVPTERKKDDKTELQTSDTLAKITMRHIKFPYLERVHALPVLVQVVHEIHDDVKKKIHSRAECAKIFEEKSELKRVKILFTVEMCFELHACI